MKNLLEAMRLAANKLPIKCKFVLREETDIKGGEADEC
jgi:large subunit ribosomal protein L16